MGYLKIKYIFFIKIQAKFSVIILDQRELQN